MVWKQEPTCGDAVVFLNLGSENLKTLLSLGRGYHFSGNREFFETNVMRLGLTAMEPSGERAMNRGTLLRQMLAAATIPLWRPACRRVEKPLDLSLGAGKGDPIMPTDASPRFWRDRLPPDRDPQPKDDGCRSGGLFGRHERYPA